MKWLWNRVAISNDHEITLKWSIKNGILLLWVPRSRNVSWGNETFSWESRKLNSFHDWPDFEPIRPDVETIRIHDSQSKNYWSNYVFGAPRERTFFFTRNVHRQVQKLLQGTLRERKMRPVIHNFESRKYTTFSLSLSLKSGHIFQS